MNPASGCIPILFQMPVLYALFIIFCSTIAFRQAPFMLWIRTVASGLGGDTAVLFSLYGAQVAILPIIMGISQFIMSRRTITDPNQKFMLYFMPVFMLLIFNKMPSGLTLYYTLFNFLAIVEQNLIKVPDFTPSVQVLGGTRKRSKGLTNLQVRPIAAQRYVGRVRRRASCEYNRSRRLAVRPLQRPPSVEPSDGRSLPPGA